MIYNCVFKDLYGETSSAVSIYNSALVILAETDENINFCNNISPIGSTIYGNGAVIYLEKI